MTIAVYVFLSSSVLSLSQSQAAEIASLEEAQSVDAAETDIR